MGVEGEKDYKRRTSKLQGLMKLCYLDYGNGTNVLMSKSSEHTLQIGVTVGLKKAETKCKVVSSLLINSDIPSTRKIFFFPWRIRMVIPVHILPVNFLDLCYYLSTVLFCFVVFLCCCCLGVFKIFLIHHHYNSPWELELKKELKFILHMHMFQV